MSDEGCLDDALVAAYLEAQLSSMQRDEVEAHLDACDLCRDMVVHAHRAVSIDPGERGDHVEEHADTIVEQATGATDIEGMTAPATISLGELVDHFRIKRWLGGGGMGDVYLARDTKLGRKVALKFIRPSLSDERGVAYRFQLEARTTARFNHPNIVTIYAIGEHRGMPYVALEYIDGVTLQQRLRTDSPEPEEALRIALAVANALSVAHAHGVLHRDLKPANVLLTTEGRVQVVDFGMAKVIADGPASQTTATRWQDDLTHIDGPTVDGGTPAYMAPEQWRGEAARSTSDVWSWGIMTYEMLTGKRPFVATTIAEAYERVTNEEPMPCLENHAPEVRDLIGRCLDKAAQQRPDVAEIVTTLENRRPQRN